MPAFELNPRRRYKNLADGEVRTGSQWMRFFRELAIDNLREIKRGNPDDNMTLEEQILWEREKYSGGVWDNELVPLR